MQRLNFSKSKANELFQAHRRKTNSSLSKLSIKMNMGASYLASVLAANRNHRPSDNMVYAMAKLLKVDVTELCDEVTGEAENAEDPCMEFDDNDDLVVVLKGSTLRMFREALASAEKRELEIRPVSQSSLHAKKLLEEALALL